jgi:hypothetical protein
MNRQKIKPLNTINSVICPKKIPKKERLPPKNENQNTFFPIAKISLLSMSLILVGFGVKMIHICI